MAMIAMVAPVLPGKEEQLRQFISEIQGPRYNDFKASRDRNGIRERTFLQHTPQGILAILTLEGDDPISGLQKMVSDQSPFMNWFVQQVKEFNGFDMRQGIPGEPPQMVLDSQDQRSQRKAA